MYIFGLGNPGKKYEHTLHNAGFEATNYLAALLGGKTRKRCFRLYKSFSSEGVNIIQPLTYMNTSGSIVHYFDLSNENVYVVCDNMDLPLGSVRIKKIEKLNTQKGLRSIQEKLPGKTIYGVFVGIGRPKEGVSVIDHVLGRPNETEMPLFLESSQKAAKILFDLINGKSLEEIQFETNRKSSPQVH